MKFLTFIALSVQATLAQQVVADEFDDRFKNIQEIIEENGFTFEAHNVTTEDGHILTMHRIPPFANATGNNRPVLL